MTGSEIPCLQRLSPALCSLCLLCSGSLNEVQPNALPSIYQRYPLPLTHYSLLSYLLILPPTPYLPTSYPYLLPISSYPLLPTFLPATHTFQPPTPTFLPLLPTSHPLTSYHYPLPPQPSPTPSSTVQQHC